METQPNNNPTPEIWQVDAGGEIYQGSFAELTGWITEGAVLPQDKVRRGNLRWIEAGRVPTLVKFFNSSQAEIVSPVVTLNSPPPFPKAAAVPLVEENTKVFCLVHTETEGKFRCDGCANFFCQECPASFGTAVKVCPMCGAMCQSLEKAREISRKAADFGNIVREGFGLKDFTGALSYPFKYPASFIFGALFFGFFSVAAKASAIGGIWLLVGSLFCWMLANMLTFGILSQTIENMMQGKLKENFMPAFDDFNLWDDVIHPLFLNLSVYLSSFGILLLVCLAMFFFVTNSSQTNERQALQTVQTFAPDAAPDFAAAQQGNKQIDFFKETVRQQNEKRQQQLNSVERPEQAANPANQFDEEKYFQQLNQQINQTRQQQLESTIGKPANVEETGLSNYYRQLLKAAIPFVLTAGIAFLWGVFYLPAAYITAAYTRNISSVFNPAIGLDTIKRLGFDYAKILLMSFFLLIVSVISSTFLNILLAPLALPRIGNIPSLALESLVTFYLFIVFSVILGSALYKNSTKFPLYQTV